MLRTIEWEIIYIIEVLKYVAAYNIAIKGVQIRYPFLPVLAGILLLPVNYHLQKNISVSDVYILFMIISIVLVFTMVEYLLKNKIWRTVIIILCISSVDSAMDQTVSRLNLPVSEEAQNIIWSFLTLLLLSAIVLGRQLMNRYKPELEISIGTRLTQASVVLAGICLCSCAALIYLRSEGKLTHLILSNLSFLAVAFLGSQVWMILGANSRMRELLTEEHLLQITQKKYYESMLAAEEDTRKYRHDMNNHFLIMDMLLEKNDLRGLEKYLKGLEEEFQTVSSRRYDTGNSIIDAISGHYLPRISDFADIKVRGKLPPRLSVDELNICTIYSNLLKNAVEELERLHDKMNVNLQFYLNFSQGMKLMKMDMRNSMGDNPKFKGILTPTSKKDRRNHGIGLSNIRRAVEQEHGSFTVAAVDGMFCAEVILPVEQKS